MIKNSNLGPLRPRWWFQEAPAGAAEALADSLKALARAELKNSPSFEQSQLYKKILSPTLPVLAALLANRGVDTGQEALDFLQPQVGRLHPWQLLPDAEKAVVRLKLARERGEKVLVHGDYDADGITATALLVRALRAWGLAASYYLPHRQEDGYGLSRAGVARGAAEGCTLLLTVDCGISNPEEVELAQSLGLDVIVTDHHLPPPQLPRALAVVNPKRADSRYPFPELAGVGVAAKLAGALAAGQESPCLQLAALGTVADMVPLVGENRLIVTLGLKEMNANPLPGIAALAQAAGLTPGHLEAEDIAFGLAPRLNAAGRMDSADPALALLLEEDGTAASLSAARLDEDNRLRRRTEGEIFGVALLQAQEQVRRGRRVLVVHGEDWHPGVIGIVAARILEHYYRPTLVLSGSGELTGSARSVAGFNIHGALTAAAESLIGFGGHAGAAGLVMAEERVASLEEALEEHARAVGLDALLQPELKIEARLAPNHISLELVDAIALLQPFGFGNPEPVFAVRGFTAGALSLVGSEKKHLRLRLEHGGGGLWAIGFGKSHLAHLLDPRGDLELAGALHLNRWQGVTRVQLQLADLQGPRRLSLEGREIVDRRGQGEPWLTALALSPQAVFFANTWWQARRMLGNRLAKCRILILPPDKWREKVYNLEAQEVCFLDPAWDARQLQECIGLLPQGCRLHFFGGAVPEDVLHPSLNLLRFFYRGWRENKEEKDLLRFLPGELAEPLLLERALAIFAEAGLAGERGRGWELAPTEGPVDLTQTRAWREHGAQLAAYRKWLEGFSAREIESLLA